MCGGESADGTCGHDSSSHPWAFKPLKRPRISTKPLDTTLPSPITPEETSHNVVADTSETTEGGGAEKRVKVDREFKCKWDGCERSFQYPNKRQWHVDFVHLREYNNVCDRIIDEKTGTKCTFKCEQPSNLKIHKKCTHDKVKEFICSRPHESKNDELCNAAFGQKQHLGEHIKLVHDKVKDFICSRPHESNNGEVCNAVFGLNGGLDEHIKLVHDKVKEFICSRPHESKNDEVCNAAFGKKDGLDRHISTVHDKRKEFICSYENQRGHICNDSFGTNGNLKKHMDRHIHHAKNRAIYDAYLEANGITATAFGTGTASKGEDVAKKVGQIMGNIAGAAHNMGIATQTKWVNEQGLVSLEDRLSKGDVAAYIHVTVTPIDAGVEEKCHETRAFMVDASRKTIWRIEGPDGDLKRFSTPQMRSVQRSYLLADCVSASDVTSLECECQRYLEDILHMPHGMCLHQWVGAGSRMEGSLSPYELKSIEMGEKLIYSLVITLIETTSRVFAKHNPEQPDTIQPLTSATVTSHNGKKNFNIVVRPKGLDFRDTPSVLKDYAAIKARKGKTSERRLKRKASP
jgi:hypothetical protein